MLQTRRESDVSDDELHQIGTVADAVGLSLRTIRHYEEVGLVVPSGRSPGGFRLYTDEDVERLRLVKRMKPLGLSLEEIGDVLELLAGPDGGPAAPAADAGVRRGERLEMYAMLAAERCERLREQLATASELTDRLSRAARAARRATA